MAAKVRRVCRSPLLKVIAPAETDWEPSRQWLQDPAPWSLRNPHAPAKVPAGQHLGPSTPQVREADFELYLELL